SIFLLSAMMFSFSDAGQPVDVLLGAAIDHVEILLLQLGGDGAAAADADLAAVQFPDGGDFGGGAGEEGLVGGIDLVPGDALFLHLQAHLGSELEDGGAGD